MAQDESPISPAEAERTTTVATFRAVTAIPSDEEARRLLEEAEWDLQRAASRFLDSHSSGSSDSTPPAPIPPPPAQQVLTSTAVARLPRPAPRRWLVVLWSPLRFVWSLVSRITTAIMRLLGGPALALEAAPGATPALRFRNHFRACYGDAHPAFFEGTYLAALAHAQAELKFLLVYIHSDAHRLTPAFCRSVLAAPAFVEAVDGRFVMWAGSVTQRDGAAAQHALRAPALPFLAVVNAPSGRVAPAADLARANFGTVLAVRAGPSAVHGGGDGAVMWLERVVQRHGGMLREARRQVEERDSARLLREQQDEEYREALQADRARERAAAEKVQREEGERQRIEELELRRERKRESMAAEPEKGPGVASVAMRLPSGEKILRRFGKEEVLEKVFDWAEVNRVDIEVACLVMTYPRKRFRYPEDAGLKIGDAGLFPSAMLLLEERGEE